MHERTGREREETGGRRRRANESAKTYVCIKKKGKKKRKFVTLIGLAGRWTRGLSVDRGSESPRFRNREKREGEIGERAPRMKKTQRAMWRRVEGKLRGIFFFFFPLQKGASCGATVGRRIDQDGVDLKGKRKRKRILRTRELGILSLSGSSSFVNLYPERKGRDARHDIRSPLEILKRLDSV